VLGVISAKNLEHALYDAMRTAALHMPCDVKLALEGIAADESDNLAREHVEVSLENSRLSELDKGLVCGDTGYPLYFVRIGSACRIESGLHTIYKAAENAVRRATDEAILRPTMVDPFTRENPGDNIGPGMPRVKLTSVPDRDDMLVVAAPKGGGSEIFGTFYQMLVPADGLQGIKKFVVESVRDACHAGKVCPPAIVGIGIGGTADLCMELAKEAALLRAVGSVHEREEIALLEGDLLKASNRLGIGPMGTAGKNAVMGVHVNHAVTHTAALPVAVNAQCLIGRRWLARIDSHGRYDLTDDISLWTPGIKP
jgi:tartrate/fumarate subfamily iron-sulfur-dependent hydro-lyase alpha chain